MNIFVPCIDQDKRIDWQLKEMAAIPRGMVIPSHASKSNVPCHEHHGSTKKDDASLKCNHDHGNNQICQSLGAWTVNYADDFLRTADLSILFYINS